jgi:hypothetical protein
MIAVGMANVRMVSVIVILNGKERIVVREHVQMIVPIMVLAIKQSINVNVIQIILPLTAPY